MTTAINDIADFARIIREQPEWADTIRGILLGQELLELPQRLAEFIASVDRRLETAEEERAELRASQARLEASQGELQASQARLEASQARLEASQGELQAGQARLEASQGELQASQARLEASQGELQASQARLESSQAELQASHAALQASHAELQTSHTELKASHVRLERKLDDFIEIANRRFDALETAVQELRRDIRPLKGAHARNGAERATRRIARMMNCRQVGLLNDDDLYDMLQANPAEAANIPRSERDSFENADIVIVAEHRESGETHYIAVEASFTAHEEDTRRAIRNAGYLSRFTGQPAHAVVAALYVAPDIERMFDGWSLHWYEIERRHMESD